MFGCLAHARRYYVKAQKVGESPSGRGLADIAIRDYIGALYVVEREIKALRERREQTNQTLTLDEVLKTRQEKSAPVAAAFRRWRLRLDFDVDHKMATRTIVASGGDPTRKFASRLRNAKTRAQWCHLTRVSDGDRRNSV